MEAAVLLAKCGYSGKGCERDYDKAIPLFVDGMHRGCPLGADWLAEAYRVGKGVPKDVDKAKEIYSSTDEEAIKKLVKQEKITYILYEDGMQYEQEACREDTIASAFTLVYESEDGRIRIYET